ncbi:sugar phosphate isomerase/epimerase family protein [Cohnella suwonensis]|uniref:Sugar phosphate isomerase/epimerase family protein n=1 Tax=Cohnella suwonensis TaxID=696072 RepID=A0ABW0LQK5_9BACL
MKLSVFTVATPDMTPEKLAAAAKKAGLSGIEWRYTEVPADVRGSEPSFWGNNLCTISPSGGTAELDRFKRAAEEAGLVSLSVTPYLRAGDLEATEKVLQAAKHIGASYIRVGVPGYDRTKPFEELFKLGREYLAEAEKLCRKYGVKGLVETHHVTIAASASGARRLVEGFDPNHIGVLYDPGNLAHEGYENYRMGLEILGPYLAHVHVKNAAWKPAERAEDGSLGWSSDWAPMKDGVVPWRQVIGDLAAVGYDGYVGIEDFSKQFADSADMLQYFADYIGGLIAELSVSAADV